MWKCCELPEVGIGAHDIPAMITKMNRSGEVHEVLSNALSSQSMSPDGLPLVA